MVNLLGAFLSSDSVLRSARSDEAILSQSKQDIEIHQIASKLLENGSSDSTQTIPRQDSSKSLLALPVAEMRSPPHAPRASRASTPRPAFFGKERALEKRDECKVEFSQDLATAQKELKNLWGRREQWHEDFGDFFPELSLEEFENKIQQQRVTRCYRLFENEAYIAGVALLKTFNKGGQEQLLAQVKESGDVDLLNEIKHLINAGFPENEESSLRPNRCVALFKEGKEREAMLWAGALVTTKERERVSMKLIEIKQFDPAAKVAAALPFEFVMSIYRKLMQEKQYASASKLLPRLAKEYPKEPAILCEKLIRDGKDDLAVEIARLNLDDFARFNLCSQILVSNPETATQIASQIKEGKWQRVSIMGSIKKLK